MHVEQEVRRVELGIKHSSELEPHSREQDRAQARPVASPVAGKQRVKDKAQDGEGQCKRQEREGKPCEPDSSDGKAHGKEQ